MVGTAASAAATILSNVPWKEVIRHTPALIESSRKLFTSFRKSRDEDQKEETSVEDLRNTLRELESHVADQSDLVSQMAQQTDAVAQGIVELESRIVHLELSNSHQRRVELILIGGVGLAVLLSAGAVVLAVLT